MNKLKLLSLLLLLTSSLLCMQDDGAGAGGYGATSGKIELEAPHKLFENQDALTELAKHLSISDLIKLFKTSRLMRKTYQSIILERIVDTWPMLHGFILSAHAVSNYGMEGSDIKDSIIGKNAKIEEIIKWHKNPISQEIKNQTLIKSSWTKSTLIKYGPSYTIEIIKTLLALGADVNAHFKNNTNFLCALHMAAQYGQVETTKVLLDGGANVNAQVYGETTPIMLAAELLLKNAHGLGVYMEIVSILLKSGADIPSNFMDYPEDIRTIIEQEIERRAAEAQNSNGAGGEPKDR